MYVRMYSGQWRIRHVRRHYPVSSDVSLTHVRMWRFHWHIPPTYVCMYCSDTCHSLLKITSIVHYSSMCVCTYIRTHVWTYVRMYLLYIFSVLFKVVGRLLSYSWLWAISLSRNPKQCLYSCGYVVVTFKSEWTKCARTIHGTYVCASGALS